MKKSLALLLVALSLSSLYLVSSKPVYGAVVHEGTWVSKSPMPTARTALGIAEVNGKIYAIGGYPDLNATEEYDPTTDTWKTKGAMPTARFNFAIAVYQNKIYCIGGHFSNRSINARAEITGAIEVYDPATDKWEIKKAMPVPRAQLEANVVNDKIYLIGGRTGGQKSTVSTNQVYDPISEEWGTRKPMPYPVIHYSSAVIGSKIFVMGGQDEFNKPMNLDVNQVYDATMDSWTIATPLPTVVLEAAACTILDSFGVARIYLVGGQLGAQGAGGTGTNLVQIYNPENSTWSIGASMLTARSGLAAAVVNNTIYAIGGKGGYILPFEQGDSINEAFTPTDGQPSSPSPVSSPTQEPFPTVTVIAIFAAALILASSLLFYFKKLRREKNH